MTARFICSGCLRTARQMLCTNAEKDLQECIQFDRTTLTASMSSCGILKQCSIATMMKDEGNSCVYDKFGEENDIHHWRKILVCGIMVTQTIHHTVSDSYQNQDITPMVVGTRFLSTLPSTLTDMER